MNSNLKTTKETLAILRCANSTFYSHLEQKDIKPIRVGTRSFFTLEQIETLKSSIDSEQAQTDSEEPGNNIEKLEGGSDEEQHSKKLIEARQEIQMLSMQVSQWQKQAQAYQEQYQQLLDNQQQQKEKVPEKNAGEKRWRDIFSGG